MSRVVLAPVFLVLALLPSPTARWVSLVLVPVMLVSDVLDGWLARREQVTSLFGYVLDGVGDRALHMAALFVALPALGVDVVFAYLLIFRDLCLYAARSLYSGWDRANPGWRWMAKGFAGATRLGLLVGLAFFYAGPLGWFDPAAVRSPTLDACFTAYFVALTAAAYLSLWRAISEYNRVAGGSPQRPQLLRSTLTSTATATVDEVKTIDSQTHSSPRP